MLESRLKSLNADDGLMEVRYTFGNPINYPLYRAI